MIDFFSGLENFADFNHFLVLGKFVLVLFVLGHIILMLLILRQIHGVSKLGSKVIPKLLEMFGVINIILSIIIIILIALPE